MKRWKLIVALVLLGLLVVFTIQNAEELQVKFLFWTLTTRRALMLFMVLVIGIIVGWVLHRPIARNRDPHSKKTDNPHD